MLEPRFDPRPQIRKRRQIPNEFISERRRQIDAEGWTPEHDDTHDEGEMLKAAIIYLWWETDKAAPLRDDGSPVGWPWACEWWKPKDRRSNLIRAGALCLAEEDRLARAGKQRGPAVHKLEIVIREFNARAA